MIPARNHIPRNHDSLQALSLRVRIETEGVEVEEDVGGEVGGVGLCWCHG